MSETAPGHFSSLHVLVLEDEAIVAMLLEDMLLELGCAEVWRAASIREAHDLLNQRAPHAAVLDVNLRGEYAYPIAARLSEAAVPFLFSTGYGAGGVTPDWAERLVLQKPFDLRTLSEALTQILA